MSIKLTMLRSHLINLFLTVIAISALAYAVLSAVEEKAGLYLLAIQALLGLYLIYAFFTTLIKSYREWRYQPSRLR